MLNIQNIDLLEVLLCDMASGQAKLQSGERNGSHHGIPYMVKILVTFCLCVNLPIRRIDNNISQMIYSLLQLLSCVKTVTNYLLSLVEIKHKIRCS